MARLDMGAVLETDSGDDDWFDPAPARACKWYSYLGLRLRLQQGEVPDYRATAVFPREA